MSIPRESGYQEWNPLKSGNLQFFLVSSRKMWILNFRIFFALTILLSIFFIALGLACSHFQTQLIEVWFIVKMHKENWQKF
jgi:hypothetical protein